jgi:hypothetical protein
LGEEPAAPPSVFPSDECDGRYAMNLTMLTLLSLPLPMAFLGLIFAANM